MLKNINKNRKTTAYAWQYLIIYYSYKIRKISEQYMSRNVNQISLAYSEFQASPDSSATTDDTVRYDRRV